MTDWKIAMLCLLPLMWDQVRLLDNRKLRVWCALMGASLATAFFSSLPAFVIIDLLAAAVVLKRPLGNAQRAIGALFVGMIMFELGFLLSHGNQVPVMVAGLQGLGWMQFAVLAMWGGHDFLALCFRRAGPAGRALSAGKHP